MARKRLPVDTREPTDDETRRVLLALTPEARSFDAIQRESGVPPVQSSIALQMLARQGLATQTGVERYQLSGDNPTLVGWRQGVVEPKVDLHEGDVFYTGDDPRIPNKGKPGETFTVLLRGPEKTAPQDIDMGIFVAEVDGKGVKYSASAKGRELRRTPPKRKIKRAAKPKTRRVYVPAIVGTKKGG